MIFSVVFQIIIQGDDDMKKYILLYSVTLAMICTIFLTGYAADVPPKEVEILTLLPQDAETTVTASGKLQYSSCASVRAGDYILVGSLYVKNGDSVEKGDVLADVYSFGQLSDAAAGLSVGDLITYASKTSVSDDLKETAKQYSVKKELTAPQGGTVTSLDCSENDIASPDTVLMRIADKKSFSVTVNINEIYINSIKPGQQVNIKFAAAGDKIYKGTVSKLASEAKQISGLSGKETAVEVTVNLDDFDDDLRIGYSAECSIITSVEKDRLIVPYEYILTDTKGDFVFLARNGHAVKCYFKAGKDYKNGAEAISGLSANDRLIRNPGALSDGDRIIDVKAR